MSNIDISSLTDTQRVGLLYALAGASYNPPTVAFRAEFCSYLQTTSKINPDEHTLNMIKKGYIDRFNGKVIKTNLNETTFDTALYNRDNGPGAAERITAKYIASLSKA
jgi:hypothetical protein